MAIKAWNPDQRLVAPLDELVEWIPTTKEAGYYKAKRDRGHFCCMIASETLAVPPFLT